MSTTRRQPAGTPSGGRFAETQRADARVQLGDANVNATAARPPADPGRSLLVDAVLSARGEVHEAQRDVRTAERGLARSFEIPPLKALARRRVRKARERLNATSRLLDSAERRLRDRDDAAQADRSAAAPDALAQEGNR